MNTYEEKSIIIVCGTLESGGAERVISILSKPFADVFKNVTIITWRDAPVFYEIDSRVSILSLPLISKSKSSIRKCLTLRNIIKTNRPCIVLSFLSIFNMITLVSLIGLKIPVIVAERNDPRFIKGGAVVKAIRSLLYRRASGILCQTESIKNYFNGPLKSKTHIIYNPITLPKQCINKASTSIKKNRIVTIGRLHPQKNHYLLIDAFKIFHEVYNDYTLCIYGKGQLTASLRKYIENNGLSNSIELAGEQSNVKDLILDAKAFVLTSNYEGMPNALIEAMCLGLPCISTRVSGAVDLIEDSKNGFLVDPNPIEISSKLADIVNNQETSREIGQRASLIYEQLRTDKIASQWIDYLNSKAK